MRPFPNSTIALGDYDEEERVIATDTSTTAHDHSSEPRRDPSPPDGTTSSVRRRRWTTFLAVIGGLVLGLGAALIGVQLFGGDDDASAPGAGTSRTAPDEVNSPEDLLPDDLPVPDGAGAESAEMAVTGFLDAESDQAFQTSFGYLSSVDRATFGSSAGWVASHANELPLIVDYQLGDVTPVSEDRATVSADVTFEPGLDQVIGLTPGSAAVRWDVVQGSDGFWGVALESSSIEPRFPSDDGVVPAAQAWADARQDCETPANERAGLVGAPPLADELCDTNASVELGDPDALDDVEARPVLTAFGPEAAAAARVVRVDGPATFGVVLVPIGSEWTVVAVLP